MSSLCALDFLRKTLAPAIGYYFKLLEDRYKICFFGFMGHKVTRTQRSLSHHKNHGELDKGTAHIGQYKQNKIHILSQISV